MASIKHLPETTLIFKIKHLFFGGGVMRNVKPKKTNRLVHSGIRLSYFSALGFLICGLEGRPAVLVLIMTT